MEIRQKNRIEKGHYLARAETGRGVNEIENVSDWRKFAEKGFSNVGSLFTFCKKVDGSSGRNLSNDEKIKVKKTAKLRTLDNLYDLTSSSKKDGELGISYKENIDFIDKEFDRIVNTDIKFYEVQDNAVDCVLDMARSCHRYESLQNFVEYGLEEFRENGDRYKLINLPMVSSEIDESFFDNSIKSIEDLAVKSTLESLDAMAQSALKVGYDISAVKDFKKYHEESFKIADLYGLDKKIIDDRFRELLDNSIEGIYSSMESVVKGPNGFINSRDEFNRYRKSLYKIAELHNLDKRKIKRKIDNIEYGGRIK